MYVLLLCEHVLFGIGARRNPFAAAAQAQQQLDRVVPLYVVVANCVAILQFLANKMEPLVAHLHTILAVYEVLQLGNRGLRGDALERDGLSTHVPHKDLPDWGVGQVRFCGEHLLCLHWLRWVFVFVRVFARVLSNNKTFALLQQLCDVVELCVVVSIGSGWHGKRHCTNHPLRFLW